MDQIHSSLARLGAHAHYAFWRYRPVSGTVRNLLQSNTLGHGFAPRWNRLILKKYRTRARTRMLVPNQGVDSESRFNWIHWTP